MSIALHCWDGEYRGSATHKAKLTEADIPSIRQQYRDGRSTREIGRAYGVDHTSIWFAVTKRPVLLASGQTVWRFHTWNHVPEVRV